MTELNVKLKELHTLPDFNNYDEDSLLGLIERSTEIHEDANHCLNIVKENVEAYVSYVQTVFDMAVEHKITNAECIQLSMMDMIFIKLCKQFADLACRYEHVENNNHVDSYVRVSLKYIADEAALGIYNAERANCRADIVREQITYILSQENEERIEKKLDETEEAVVENVVKVMERKSEDDINIKFVKSNKTFADVAGLREVKEDLMQIVDFIKRPEVYEQYGAKLPKGTILYGPPGTGKTLLAKAIAGEAEANFIALCSTDFTASKWGVVPKMIKDVFDTAAKNTPCVIFIDEIDMLGMNRNGDAANSLAHREALNSFLSAMDGFDEYNGVTVLAATNMLEDLDPALMRPGRFDNLFAIPLPQDVHETEEVVRIYMKNKYFDNELSSYGIAKKLMGRSPAGIESVLNEACLIAIKKNKGVIRECDISEAVTKKSIKGHIRELQEVTHEDKKLTALHEAGHTVVALAKNLHVQSVSIIGTTTGAGGLTTLEHINKHYFTKADYENQILVSYGGRAAEELAFGPDMITTGASQDIKRATELIKDASTNYGFDMYDSQKQAPMVYKTIAQVNIEKAANKYYRESVNILKNNLYALREMARELMENGRISGDRAKEIYQEYKDSEMEME